MQAIEKIENPCSSRPKSEDYKQEGRISCIYIYNSQTAVGLITSGKIMWIG